MIKDQILTKEELTAATADLKQKDFRAFIRRSAGELNGRSVDLFQVVDILCGIERPGVEV